MKHIRSILAALMFLSALSAVAQSRGNQPFDLMKSLAGNWEGKNNMDESVQVSYRLTGGGSALMSEIQTQMRGRGEGMISMIHMDGGRLLLTHYCAAGNQPRMQASASPDGKSITFDFIDATNLAGSQPGHMQRVIFTFVDANHHTEEWHFAAPGKEIVQKFDLQKKS